LNPAPPDGDEAQAIAARYARRRDGDRYSPQRPEVQRLLQERQRALQALLAEAGLENLSTLHLVEVGCGSGGNLQELLRMGFSATNMCGIELLPERLAQSRAALPAALWLHGGDALQAPVAPGSMDIVYLSTVLSSLLDDAYQQRLADTLWGWLKPGGAVLVYDFTVNNPRNPDVRGVPLARLRALFPQARLRHRRVTLAPPLARVVVRLHPGLYDLVNTLPLLRTHVLAWLQKPATAAAR